MLRSLIDFITPQQCAVCVRNTGVVCEACWPTAHVDRSATCPFCNGLSDGGRSCANCRRKHKLAGATIPWRLEGTVQELIHTYKYNHNRSIADYLGGELANHIDWAQYDVVSYVPNDGASLRKRGFDHGRYLARATTNAAGVSLSHLLLRVRHTPQVGHGRIDRFSQVRNNFMLATARDLSGQRVLLIDDVLTTGATLAECARLLKSAGARQVWGVALAKK